MKNIIIRFNRLFLPVFFIFIFSFVAYANPLKKPLSFQNITPKDGLSAEMVNAVAVYGEEVWFGTYAGGATRYNPSKHSFEAYTTKGEPMDKVDKGESIHWQNLLPYNHVSMIVSDKDRIWFGTNFYGFGGGGISYYTPRPSSWKRLKVSVRETNDNRAKKIISAAIDGDQLWVGSEKGLSLLDKKTETWKAFYSAQEGLSGNFVNSILVQPGFLWVGTNGGISRFDKTKKTWKNYAGKAGLGDGEIKAIAQAGQKIWAGDAQGTIFEYDAVSDRWKKMEADDALKNGGIYSMTVIQGKVFICRDNGVSVFDLSTGQWESLTVSDGLLSNTVFCATEDKNGIWFGTDKGASKLVMTP